jgi:hypothetical protein
MECLVVADAGIDMRGCPVFPRIRGWQDGVAAVTERRRHASSVRKARFPMRRGSGHEVSQGGTCH